ncbi:hypothetical protein [Nostoc sp.]|uniref:hypothetical protein n=1 Tax=Nostoc sp. TaxID=1180 RepID=UPI002FF6F735
MSVLELQQSVLNSLQNLKSLDALKKLFWSQLNYERVNKELSHRQLTDAVANELTEDPLLLASGGANNAFHIIYARLSSEELSRQSERKVVDYLLKEHPYTEGLFPNNKTFIIPLNDIYLLGVLNSIAVWEYLKTACSQIQGKTLELRSIYMNKIPIPNASTIERETISQLVQKCLDAKGVNCEIWEKEIDERVAALYGL